MADGYDRFENAGGGGGSFVMGLLTGTVLGAGLGMLLAPKSGSELRSQLGDHAASLGRAAGEQLRRAGEVTGTAGERSRTPPAAPGAVGETPAAGPRSTEEQA